MGETYVAPAWADHAWQMLRVALDAEPLPRADGSLRYATVDEFMLMSVEPARLYQFKHRQTRSYLSVSRRWPALVIPFGGFYDD